MINALIILTMVLTFISGWFSCIEGDYKTAWNISQAALIVCEITVIVQINKTIDILNRFKP